MENLTIPEFEDIILEDVSQEEKNNTEVKESNDNNVAEDVIMSDSEKEQSKQEYGENADATAVAIFEELVNKGILDESDRNSFDGSWEKIEESLDTLPQRVLNGIIQQAPDLTKNVVRFAFSSDNITRDDLVNFLNTYLEETKPETVDISTMDDARDYLYKVYEDRGLKPKAINAALNSLEDEGDLLDEAKKEYEKMQQEKQNTPKSEKLIADKQNEKMQQDQQRMQFIESLNNELEATGWKPTKVNQIRQNFSNVNQILQDVYKNPKSLVKLVDFLTYYNNGDIDYTKFINSLETPKAKEFKSRFQDIVNSPTLSTKSNFKNPNSKSDDEIPII